MLTTLDSPKDLDYSIDDNDIVEFQLKNKKDRLNRLADDMCRAAEEAKKAGEE